MKIELRQENQMSYPDAVVGLLQMITNGILHSDPVALPSEHYS